MSKPKVCVIGPSPKKSRGGMSTVIQGIQHDKLLHDSFDITIFDSYIDGNIITRAFYSLYAFLKFKVCCRDSDLYHIHMASYGSTFRIAAYIRFLKKHHKKVIVHIHGAAYMDFYEKLSEKRKKYVVAILKSCDEVIALSDEWKARFERVFGLNNCTVISNGIDTALYEQAITKPGDYTESFLFLGRLGKRKGTYDVIDAVAILNKAFPQMKLYLAGDGEIEQVKTLVHQKHLDRNVQVIGWVEQKQKIELLQKTAIIVLPSYNEGLPMTILEGMAAGKAIISSTVGAIPEVIDADNGILIEAGDVQGLAHAMQFLMEHPELVSAMGRNNIEKINQIFSIQKMHANLAEVYLKVLNTAAS